MDRDSREAKAFISRRNANNAAATLLADVIDRMPHEFCEPFISRVKAGLEGISEEEIYSSVLESACGLDTENSERDRILSEDYISKCVKRLDNSAFESNPFLTDINIPEGRKGDWETARLSFGAYEPFPLGQILLDTRYGTEVPLIGYFPRPFSCPVIKQGGREWMAVKPSEILTMEAPLAAARGNVVVFGLGIGYFAYMASRKPEVSSVTVIEIDGTVIDIFNEFILPQFPDRDKVRVLKADAFEYAERDLPSSGADFAFVDLWHDASDGTDMYLRFSQLAALSPCTRFEYWIEPLLLSNLRWRNFDALLDRASSPEEFRSLLFASIKA